jgi:hypothetical protein
MKKNVEIYRKDMTRYKGKLKKCLYKCKEGNLEKWTALNEQGQERLVLVCGSIVKEMGRKKRVNKA